VEPDTLADLQRDPLAFVTTCFRWGEGELADSSGPRQWQRQVLADIGQRISDGAEADEAIRLATASGHGIGKSCLVAMVILWALVTRIDTRGVVTANTEKQLTTKTWPELAKWHRLCILGGSFVFTATSLYSADPAHEKTWRVDAIPWSLNNTEAFAGLHNKGRRVLVIFDEASAIADEIWEVTEGALTDADTEILWLAFGNPTRNTGRFRECFGRLRHRWAVQQIDSREVEGTNLKQMQAWVEDYGEDSDFVRVRVRGVFPRAGVSQFISGEVIELAQKRQLAFRDDGAAMILGVDIARFGDDQSVIRGRKGRDGRVIRPIKWRGMDTVYSAGRIAEAIMLYKPEAVFIDGGGVGGGVVDILKARGFRIVEVNFGSVARQALKYANKRAEMWGDMRDWLETGVIDPDQQLSDDMQAPEYGFDKDGRLQLERKADMKKRGLASPDDGDAFALTFAEPVQRTDVRTSTHRPPRLPAQQGYSVLD
jgi:hypothetical protein